MFLGYIMLQLFCIYNLCYYFAREIIIIIIIIIIINITLNGDACVVYKLRS